MTITRIVPAVPAFALLACLGAAGCDAPATGDGASGDRAPGSASVLEIPTAAPSDTVEPVRLWEYGAEPSEYAFQYVVLGALRGDGVAVVGDGGANAVVAIDPAAGDHRILAASGQEPGEVGYARQIVAGRDDEIWVEDTGNGRLLLFEGDSLRRSVPPDANPLTQFDLMPIGLDEEGRMLVTTGGYPREFEAPWLDGTLAVFDPSGGTEDGGVAVPVESSVDTIGSFPIIRRLDGPPFSPFPPSGEVTVAGSRFVTARTDLPELTWWEGDGEIARTVRWDAPPRYPDERAWDDFRAAYTADFERLNPQLGNATLERLVEQRLAEFEVDPEEALPLFDDIRGAESGDVWIAAFANFRGVARDYAVMSEAGAWRAVVRFDRPFRVLHVTDEVVLGVHSGELDVQTIAAYENPFRPGG